MYVFILSLCVDLCSIVSISSRANQDLIVISGVAIVLQLHKQFHIICWLCSWFLSWERPTFLAFFCFFFCFHPVQHSGCIAGNVFSERYDGCQSWYSVDLRRNKSRLDACDAPICAEVVCVQLAAFICNSHWEVMEQRLSVSHCRCVFIDDQMNGAKGCENTIRI